jgi:hypothetical protein
MLVGNNQVEKDDAANSRNVDENDTIEDSFRVRKVCKVAVKVGSWPYRGPFVAMVICWHHCTSSHMCLRIQSKISMKTHRYLMTTCYENHLVVIFQRK